MKTSSSEINYFFRLKETYTLGFDPKSNFLLQNHKKKEFK